MALVSFRDYATQKGLKMDWNQEQGVLINNTPVDIKGLINYGNAPEEGYQPNTYYGTQEQIDGLIAPFTTTPPPASIATGPASGGLIGLREAAEQKGLAVSFDPKLGVLINGTPIDTKGFMNYGASAPTGYQNDTYYGTQEQVDKALSPYVVPAISPEVGKAEKNYKEWSEEEYVSAGGAEIEAKMKEILSRTFNYDPANDAQFQLAAKELTRNVLESMAARGIAASSLTVDNVAQGVGNLLPEYQQLAQQRFQDEGQVLMSQMDMLLGMDETKYNRYQDEGKKYAQALEVAMQMDQNQFDRWEAASKQRYTEAKDKTLAQEKLDAKKRQEISDAWDKTSQLGYVDNDSAIILGVDPSTLSKEAREAKEKREWELADAATQHAQQLAVIEAQYQKEKKIVELKNEGKETPAVPEAKPFNMPEMDMAVRYLQGAQAKGAFIASQMVQAGYSDDAIIKKLNEHGLTYNPSTDTFSEKFR